MPFVKNRMNSFLNFNSHFFTKREFSRPDNSQLKIAQSLFECSMKTLPCLSTMARGRELRTSVPGYDDPTLTHGQED